MGQEGLFVTPAHGDSEQRAKTFLERIPEDVRMKEKSRELTHLFLLILTAVIWGMAFVAQSLGAEHVGPLAFLSIRS